MRRATIGDIRFGRATKPKFITDSTVFYVYHNLVPRTFIVGKVRSPCGDIGIESDIAAILSHETLHKVIFKLEGGKPSSGLDKWCRSRNWLYQDDSGVCFLRSDLGVEN